ncbi:MAG TPA: DNA-directed RNA polymerase subunit beta' [candidate division WOR-3 bacterium]|uniref:DNA-directed RNA polymerase subunit beta' n=1 Tax=candidate division WOR-3 bacterium TaxID=2052148 RepID=A0A7V0T5H9_UNCW3|nr:DNA-directed RNA polymerase subunit beta' [candidate division WOR-3 bacterium]
MISDRDFHDFDALRLRIASSETIRGWSSGEVVKPETINYRTQKPERDGLFCERIFGPVKDYECNCGKYKKIRYKGIQCDRCGVEVTTSAVRRQRMGHIDLVVPVAHTLFYQVPPSKVGLMLALSINQVETILNYEAYVVIEAGESNYKPHELLTEEEYRANADRYRGFQAASGAPALKTLLSRIELDDLAAELRARIKHETSRRFDLLRRLRVVEAFRTSGARPEWMMLEVLPVIPPDLRPLVPLEGGRYATSDLNDLYKRVIVRNNRLKHLMSIKTPEIILKNEKRMLQDAVDTLFSNETRPRPVRGRGNRPLKSLCEALRGKQGRFRRNLLGKRVDYSGRSVIVVNPALKLHQCSLPKEMALELFKPVILRQLEERRLADSERGAKTMYRKEAPEVWEVLEAVTSEHPVLLNRAPTLHRVSVEAFFPILAEQRAIGIHPLVCPPFNADFDGDTMSVHVPLTPEAILESAVLMLSSHNILSPAHGRPLMMPSQDIVAGIYYMTKPRPSLGKAEPHFDDFGTVHSAYELGELDLHAPVFFHHEGVTHETTVGRVLLNEVLPAGLRFVNHLVAKGELAAIIDRAARKFGLDVTARLLDDIKDLGFEMATRSGLSIGMDDVVVPAEKDVILDRSEKQLRKVHRAYERGLMSDSEKYNLVVNIWTLATAEVEEALFDRLSHDQEGFNPIYMLIDSGARGSRTQAAQIGGMRGLMAKPQRRSVGEEVIETPIKSSFRDGLSVWEYFISTHGARKGLTDTALKTAEAGYLTRRLVDVAQDVVITIEDCGTILGQEVTALREGGDIVEPLGERIAGCFAVDDVTNPVSGEVIVAASEEISDEAAQEIEDYGIEMVRVRSVLTCEAPYGLCQKCYGRNLAAGRLVEIGEAVGVVAAQSIGEPGTQLTLKTFHIGGIAQRAAEQTKATARFAGAVKFENLKTAVRSDGEAVALDPGRLVLSAPDRAVPFSVPSGAVVKVKDGQEIADGDVLFEWEPYSISIMARAAGKVVYHDIEVGITLREDIDERTERMQRIITNDRSRKRHPRIAVVSKTGKELEVHALPAGAYLIADDKQEVLPGDGVARLLREMGRTRDITGGLPKVAELFEAKKVKEPAIISEIDGSVEVSPPKEGIRLVQVTSDGGSAKEYQVPYGRYLLVATGDTVRAGDKLCEGSVDPHDVLKVKGWLSVQEFLTNQIQSVYRLQKVKINDKHISVIVRQMLRKVKVIDAGDSSFIEGEIVERRRLYDENQHLAMENLRPAGFQPILLGITRAALLTESFLSAASFQETTRVLSEAAIAGRLDRLRGLKENVIVGRLVPAGTGFRDFSRLRLVADEPERGGPDGEPAEVTEEENQEAVKNAND